MGGREGMPRSLGSIYGGSVTRFLAGLRSRFARTIATPGIKSGWNGVAVSRDGSALLVSDYGGGSHAIHVFSVLSGAFLRTIGCYGTGPLQFKHPCQVWVAHDGFVFVADTFNDRLQILTPCFNFHSVLGEGNLSEPCGVCADDDVVVAVDDHPARLVVFHRGSGRRLRSFGSVGYGNGQMHFPTGLCFLARRRHVAFADQVTCRVCVWTLGGEFVHYMRCKKDWYPRGVACSDAGDLIIVDWYERRIEVISASGDIVWASETSTHSGFTGVTVHGSTIFGQTRDGKCIVYS